MSDLRHRVVSKSSQSQAHPSGTSSSSAEIDSQSKPSFHTETTTPSHGRICGVSAFTIAALLVLLPIRMLSALSIPIQDCDETFNYWEPLHHLLFGRGLQTWEYSPLYGLRSYLYLWIISPAAWLGKWGYELWQDLNPAAHTQTHQRQEVDKMMLFYAVRLSFVLTSAFVEVKLLSSVRRLFGSSIARWMLLFLACGTGMIHSATAFLPQTFTMIFVMLTLNPWMNRDYAWAIFYTGVCSLIGWPFSVILSVPLALEILWVYRGFSIIKPIWWGAVSLAICVIPSLIVDQFYYRRFIFAVVNIALYNSDAAGDHGANLFGREPPQYYVVNLFLNFNVASGLAYAAPLLLSLAPKCSKVPLGFSALSLFRLLTPFYIWLLLFTAMPHKEERFLFVVYPSLCFCAAVGASSLMHFLRGAGGSCRRVFASLVSLVILAIFLLLSTSRLAALIINYSAPLTIWTKVHDLAVSAANGNVDVLPFPHPLPLPPAPAELPEDASVEQIARAELAKLTQTPTETISVCVGKEWYRFGTSFFLPTIHLPNSKPIDFRLKFIDSSFGGLLPKEFEEEWQFVARKAKEKFSSLQDQKFPNSSLITSYTHPYGLPKEFLSLQHQKQQHPAGEKTQQQPSRTVKSVGLKPSQSLVSTLLSHASSRPGTFVLPQGMNRDNRKEDSGRFVKPQTCELVVDLQLPEQSELVWSEHRVMLTKEEMIQGKCVKGWSWEVIAEESFLSAGESHNSLARAFWIPGVSKEKNVFRPYQLLQRVPIECGKRGSTTKTGEQRNSKQQPAAERRA